MTNLPAIWTLVERQQSRFTALADRVWDTPEICYQEVQSSAAHVAELEALGFRVSIGGADIPTAVIGEAGQGGPVIAFIGEFDALPHLSQQAGIARQMELAKGGHGHGCGHHLLGAGAMLAAAAVRDWLSAEQRLGTVRYYGCPAEEGGAAKAFMVKAGLLDDVDIAISWHPGCFADVITQSWLANARLDFSFTGRAAHAAAAPHLGRSALDAVELMNVGVNYMREHMPDSARIHYAVIDSGGVAANVVQRQAKVRYAVRSKTLPELLPLVDRVKNVAQGAALMTETQVLIEVISGTANLVNAPSLDNIMRNQLEQLGPPDFDENERLFAREIQSTLSEFDIANSFALHGIEPVENKALGDILPPAKGAHARPLMVSGDLGDISWVVPTAQLFGATFAVGTQFHSWQMVAQGKTAAAHKGMVHAAKVMAATAVDLFRDQQMVKQIKTEHANRWGKSRYKSVMPDDAMPPINMVS
jgi:aminobenzoyl-glutamate utilization protein B